MSGFELIMALGGIAGTLIGTAIGAVVTWKVQSRIMENENRTRFHKQRLDVYSAFTNAATRVIGEIRIDNSPWIFTTMERLNEAQSQLQLVASDEVSGSAALVHAAVLECRNSSDADEDVHTHSAQTVPVAILSIPYSAPVVLFV